MRRQPPLVKPTHESSPPSVAHQQIKVRSHLKEPPDSPLLVHSRLTLTVFLAIGNVSFEVPTLHPVFGIPTDSTEVGPHHPGFEHAAGQPSGFQAALEYAKTMSATGLEILSNQKIRQKMWAEHRERFGSA